MSEMARRYLNATGGVQAFLQAMTKHLAQSFAPLLKLSEARFEEIFIRKFDMIAYEKDYIAVMDAVVPPEILAATVAFYESHAGKKFHALRQTLEDRLLPIGSKHVERVLVGIQHEVTGK